MPQNGLPHVIGMAQKLRKRETSAEKILWEHLRNCKMEGYKFRRQHPMGRFILDFYCPKVRLAVEIDSKYRDMEEIRRYDEFRQRMIEEDGIVFLRFRNEEVMGNLGVVLEQIGNAMKKRVEH